MFFCLDVCVTFFANLHSLGLLKNPLAVEEKSR